MKKSIIKQTILKLMVKSLEKSSSFKNEDVVSIALNLRGFLKEYAKGEYVKDIDITVSKDEKGIEKKSQLLLDRNNNVYIREFASKRYNEYNHLVVTFKVYKLNGYEDRVSNIYERKI